MWVSEWVHRKFRIFLNQALSSLRALICGFKFFEYSWARLRESFQCLECACVANANRMHRGADASPYGPTRSWAWCLHGCCWAENSSIGAPHPEGTAMQTEGNVLLLILREILWKWTARNLGCQAGVYQPCLCWRVMKEDSRVAGKDRIIQNSLGWRGSQRSSS